MKNPLGTINLPLKPSFLRMVDRADGTVWTLTHDQGTIRFGIDNTALSDWQKKDSHLYAAYEGPCHITVEGIGVRWLIRGGRLGYETVDGIADVASPPPLSRESNVEYFLKLVVPTTWVREGDVLGYTEIATAP